jgi:hypothetical protein
MTTNLKEGILPKKPIITDPEKRGLQVKRPIQGHGTSRPTDASKDKSQANEK